MHIPEGEGTSPLIIEFEVEESPYPVLNAMVFFFLFLFYLFFFFF